MENHWLCQAWPSWHSPTTWCHKGHWPHFQARQMRSRGAPQLSVVTWMWRADTGLKTPCLIPHPESFQLLHMVFHIKLSDPFQWKGLCCHVSQGLSPHLINHLPLLIQGCCSSFSLAPTVMAAHPSHSTESDLPQSVYSPAFQTPFLLFTCSSVSWLPS